MAEGLFPYPRRTGASSTRVGAADGSEDCTLLTAVSWLEPAGPLLLGPSELSSGGTK